METGADQGTNDWNSLSPPSMSSISGPASVIGTPSTLPPTNAGMAINHLTKASPPAHLPLQPNLHRQASDPAQIDSYLDSSRGSIDDKPSIARSNSGEVDIRKVLMQTPTRTEFSSGVNEYIAAPAPIQLQTHHLPPSVNGDTDRSASHLGAPSNLSEASAPSKETITSSEKLETLITSPSSSTTQQPINEIERTLGPTAGNSITTAGATDSVLPGSTTSKPHDQTQGLQDVAVVGSGDVLTVEFLTVSGKRRQWTFGSAATVKQVKEMIWRTWPEDWRTQGELPFSADALRLLYLGKFLDDKLSLSSCGIKPGPNPTIVHLTIRNLAINDEDDEDALLKPTKSAAASICNCGCILS